MPLNLIQGGIKALSRITPTSVGRDVLGGARAYLDPVKEPQHAYRWEVSFRGMFADDARNLTYYAKSTGIPPMMNDVIKRYYAGVEYAYSGRDSSPRVFRVTFWDNQNLEAYHYFNKWMTTMNDPVERRKVNPENYQREIILKLKDTTDLLVNEQFAFGGCFPFEVSEMTLSYGESAEVTFDVMFHFTRRLPGGA